MIRKAIINDLPALVNLTKELCQESQFSQFTQIVEDDVFTWLEAYINHPVFEVFVAEKDGAIIGYLNCFTMQTDFNRSHKVASEDKWFVTAEHRKSIHGARLLETFIKWAQTMKANSIVVDDRALIDEGGIERILTKKLFKMDGHSYRRIL